MLKILKVMILLNRHQRQKLQESRYSFLYANGKQKLTTIRLPTQGYN